MRVAGDGWRDDTLPGVNEYLPGTVPTDTNARNRLLFYRRDSAIPKHRVNWNFLVDLPFGKGKMFGRNAGRALDALIGGWQIAGFGQLTPVLPDLHRQRGEPEPHRILRQAVSHQGLPERRLLRRMAHVERLHPGQPDQPGKPEARKAHRGDAEYPPHTSPTPLHCGRRRPTAASRRPDQPYYESNTVWVPLNNGTVQRTTLGGFVDPLQHQYRLGPLQWNMSASMFKTMKLTERASCASTWTS